MLLTETTINQKSLSPYGDLTAQTAEAGAPRKNFADILKAYNCPYSSMAKNGVIEYKGCTFVCDYENNRLTVGDVSRSSDCLFINLPSGGTLAVNKADTDSVANAIGMFSAEDQLAIMEALMINKMAEEKKDELDNEKDSSGDSLEARLGQIDLDDYLRRFGERIRGYDHSEL